MIRTGVCENGWSRVQYKDKDAYIYGEYLTTEKPKKDAPAAKVSGEEVGTIQIGDEPEPVTLQSEVLGQIEKEMNTEKEMQAKEETLSETHTLTGTVLEVNMNMLTVSEKGKEYTINVAMRSTSMPTGFRQVIQ